MRSFSWEAADGSITDLNDPLNGLEVLAGSFGLNAPPVSNVTAALVALDGSLLVKRRRPERMFGLRMKVTSPTQNVQGVIRTLTSALQGPGVLTVSDGTVTRSLRDVYYSDGLEGDYSINNAVLPIWQRFVIVFTALDPWWYGDLSTVTLGFGSEVDFDDASTTFDDVLAFDGSTTTPLTVSGDAPALPSFTLEGPFDTCQVGIAGGSSFALASALSAGDVITVSTERGSRGPRLNGGSIDWSLLTSTSRLFDLPVGSMSIQVSTSGTTGASSAEMTYRQRWLTP